MVWDRIEQLVDRAPSVQALGGHRLHLIAARVRSEQGSTLPDELRAEQRRAAMIAIAARPLLERARAAYGGKLMLMKGAEVAAHYRHPSDRFFCDLDLLADDAASAQQALIKAGFVQCGDPATYEHPNHLCPLAWPGVPLFIELHRRPSSPDWLPRTPTDEILSLTVPSATGVEGLLAPHPAVHALLLVAHSWAEAPLRRLIDLIDVAAVMGSENRARADDLARRWGWEGMWHVAASAGEAVLGNRALPASLSLWARHLMHARDRTVLENHLSRIAAPASALPITRAPGALASAMRLTANRHSDEPWSHKLRRSGLAVAHAFMATSSHERKVSERLTR
ncbi:MAG TPA: nucleotidyltransferase family protein [Solirubrobacteraceae bacterium]|nr:nucleotidyltransferase family protein [Solirubrobacteraceae bacterium]